MSTVLIHDSKKEFSGGLGNCCSCKQCNKRTVHYNPVICERVGCSCCTVKFVPRR